jgi:hypothetical protein
MKLRRSFRNRGLSWAALFALSWGVALGGCERDDTVQVDRNLPPETFITEGPSPSPDPNRPTQVFYQVHLYWRGEDRDGTIAGFRYAIDDTTDPGSWNFTTKTDSVFRFRAGEVGALEHLFLIRAVDNQGKQDATPDTLRFESFTVAQPVVQYDTTRIVVENANGTQVGLGTRDTVLINSRVTMVWSGFDEDGEVVGWESVFRNQQIDHARNDTTRTIGPLNSARHEFTVRAIDDAGAKSTTGGFFQVVGNFDPRTTILKETIRSRLIRTWLTPMDTIQIQHYPPGGAEQDTIPFGASLAFDWETTDPDGPVVLYSWSLSSFQQGQTIETRINTDSLIVCEVQGDSIVCDTTFVPLELDQRTENRITVRGIDVYGRVEGNPTPVPMYYNFPPAVTIADSVTSVPAGEVLRFWFRGEDRDSNRRDLRYSWQFDDDFESPITEFNADSTFVEAFYDQSEIGTHRLIVTAFDQSGTDRPSVPDTLFFSVFP